MTLAEQWVSNDDCRCKDVMQSERTSQREREIAEHPIDTRYTQLLFIFATPD